MPPGCASVLHRPQVQIRPASCGWHWRRYPRHRRSLSVSRWFEAEVASTLDSGRARDYQSASSARAAAMPSAPFSTDSEPGRGRGTPRRASDRSVQPSRYRRPTRSQIDVTPPRGRPGSPRSAPRDPPLVVLPHVPAASGEIARSSASTHERGRAGQAQSVATGASARV